MATPLAEAHITAQERLRRIVAAAIALLWQWLPNYDEDQVDPFLAIAVPLILAGQTQAVALTDAFLARAVGRAPLGLPRDGLTGSALRNGAPLEEVYRRPFVETWTALRDGQDWVAAVEAGEDRLTSTAETDVQLAMRETLREVGEADPEIFGYQRVTDGDACNLCLVASTQRYHTDDLLPIHNRCGCSVDVITDPDVGRVINRDLYRRLKSDGVIDDLTRQRRASRFRERAELNQGRAAQWRQQARVEDDAARKQRLEERADRYEGRVADQLAAAERAAEGRKLDVTAAVVKHGELGPVLVNAAHHFKEL